MTTTASSPITFLDVLRDRALFGSTIRDPSWQRWICCAAALFGLVDSLDDDDRAFIQRRLSRSTLPTRPAREAWLIIGRRGGKSRFAALVAVYLAAFHDHSRVLAPGERGVLMVIASDRRQARVVHGYVSGLLHAVPMLTALIVHETREAIELSNRITIEIHTASFRAIRGYTAVGAICDEVAYWRSEDSANPDTEILNALRPAMATVPGAMLLCISSPYARRGELWKAYRQYYGEDDAPVLVWQADTRTMNPTVPQAFIDQAYAEDEAVARAEYGGEFRSDLEGYVSREALDAVVVPGRLELPPVAGCWYWGFVDPSGGSVDSMTLAIGHDEGDRRFLDAVREWRPPFSPESVVSECAALLRTYRVGRVTADRYAGEWPRQRFRARGILYDPSKSSKSQLYQDFLPLINSRRVELLDHPRLLAQLGGLERRTGRDGRDFIDHPPRGHDDVANAVAGVLAHPRPPVPRIRRL